MNSTTTSATPGITEPIPLPPAPPQVSFDKSTDLPSGDNCLACTADDRLRFASLSGDEFITAFRHRLALLTVRVQSDMPELENRIAANTRRLNYLENKMPGLMTNRALINEVRAEVRALKRTVTELHLTIERQNRPLLDKLSDSLRELFSPYPAPRA